VLTDEKLAAARQMYVANTHTVDPQTLLDAFLHDYNHQRPHRSLPHHATPATAYEARPNESPRL
jgi:transposase InsO family protein